MKPPVFRCSLCGEPYESPGKDPRNGVWLFPKALTTDKRPGMGYPNICREACPKYSAVGNMWPEFAEWADEHRKGCSPENTSLERWGQRVISNPIGFVMMACCRLCQERANVTDYGSW